MWGGWGEDLPPTSPSLSLGGTDYCGTEKVMTLFVLLLLSLTSQGEQLWEDPAPTLLVHSCVPDAACPLEEVCVRTFFTNFQSRDFQ